MNVILFRSPSEDCHRINSRALQQRSNKLHRVWISTGESKNRLFCRNDDDITLLGP